MRGGADSPSSDKVEIACGDCGARYLVPTARVRGRVFRFTCRRCEKLVVARCEGGAVTSLPAGAESAASASVGEAVGDPEDQTDYAEPQADTAGAWYVMLGKEPHGPIGLAELGALVREQRIDGEAQVWSPTGSGWQRLAAVPALTELLGESQNTRFYRADERSRPTASDGANAYWRSGETPPAADARPTTIELSATSAVAEASRSRSGDESTAVAAALPLAPTLELSTNDSALSGAVSRGRTTTPREASPSPRETSPSPRRGASEVPEPAHDAASTVDPLLATHAYEPETEGARLPLAPLRPAGGNPSGGSLDSASYRLAQAVEHAREWGREIDPRWGVSPGRVGTLRAAMAQPQVRGERDPARRAPTQREERRGWSAVRAQPQHAVDDPAASPPGTAPARGRSADRVAPARGRRDPRGPEAAWELDTADDAARFDDFARAFPPDHGVVASARLPTGYRGGVVAKVPAGGAGALAVAPVYAPPLPPAGRVTLAPNLLLPLRPRFWSARRGAIAAAGALAVVLVLGGLTLAYLWTHGPAPASTRALISATPPPRASDPPPAPAPPRPPAPPTLPATAPAATAPAAGPARAAAHAVAPIEPGVVATGRSAVTTTTPAPAARPPALPPPARATNTSPRPSAAQPAARAQRSAAPRRPARPPRRAATEPKAAPPGSSRAMAHRAGPSSDLTPDLDVGLPAASKPRPNATATRRVDVDELLSVGSGRRPRRAEPPPDDAAPSDPAPKDSDDDGDGAADLPRTLTKAQVAAVMRQLRPQVQRCLDQHPQPGRLTLRVAIQPYGRASGQVGGELAGTATASCAERALTTMRFPRFTGEPIRFSYAFDLH